jgi:hypothetical protein
LFRCKLCHFTNDDECAQVRHSQEQHSGETVNYNVTSAAVVLSGILVSCFGDYMPASQLEFAEEMASERTQESPQGSPQAVNGKA